MKVSVLFFRDLPVCFHCNTLMFATVFCSCIAQPGNVRVTLFLLMIVKAVLDWYEALHY